MGNVHDIPISIHKREEIRMKQSQCQHLSSHLYPCRDPLHLPPVFPPSPIPSPIRLLPDFSEPQSLKTSHHSIRTKRPRELTIHTSPPLKPLSTRAPAQHMPPGGRTEAGNSSNEVCDYHCSVEWVSVGEGSVVYNKLLFLLILLFWHVSVGWSATGEEVKEVRGRLSRAEEADL